MFKTIKLINYPSLKSTVKVILEFGLSFLKLILETFRNVNLDTYIHIESEKNG